MRQFVKLWVAALTLAATAAFAQTSWKGTTSTDWSAAANWTAGVPASTTDAIIGDANFTGANQPSLTASSVCKSLTLGTGTKASTLTVGKAFTVSGNVVIGANGTVSHTAAVTLSLTGNWTNSGAYNTSNTKATVAFSGTTQTIGGSTATAFRKLTINSSSTTTLAVNISVANQLTVSGTLDPTTFTVSGAGKLVVNAGGRILVKASTFAGNYANTGATTLNAGSIVEYAAGGNQTVANTLTYSTLRISGSGVKTLAGNLPALVSSATTAGNIDVAAGTLDLSTFTANRGTTTVGGTFSVGSGATLKIGGTGTFPPNYATHTISATSTVEYNGTNQTLTAEAYGHLTLSSSSGAVTKTMPTNAVTVAGNLTATPGAGTSVAFTAAAALTVNGAVSLAAGTTFAASTFTHSVAGNWTNSGTFTGGTSTLTLSGSGATITGTGDNNLNNLTITGAGVTAATNTALTVSGNLATAGAGTFTHTAGGTGTVTMSGASKTISGTGIIFNNLTASGSASTTSSFTIAGNFVNSGSLSATAGTITMGGAGKTISGSGTSAFKSLAVTGSVTTTNNFSVSGNLAVSGTFSATAGTATFNGSSVLSGTANLFNATLNGTSLQLGANATLGVAGTLTLTAGSFDATSATPNNVNFNVAGAQSVPAATYDNLTLAGSGTKTAGGALTVNRDLTIGSGATFSAGSYTHSLYGNWINSGAFTAGGGTVQLLGGSDVSISGATTFATLTLNKSSTANVVTLNTNVTAATLNMTSGKMETGSNTVTITTTRTGNGFILGTITRTHAFTTGTAYAFESPSNTVSFASLGTVSSVTVAVASAPVGDFPYGASINRQYTISLTASGAYSATLRLHYDDAELNGNTESVLNLWRYSSAWAVSGRTTGDSTGNWVEQSAVTDITGRWTLAGAANNVARWNGSVSTAWTNAANWIALQGIPSLPPGTNDIAELGTATFTSQPTITSVAAVKSLSFGSAQAVTLTLGAGGSLETIGNVSGSWTNNATHTIAVGSRTLTVGGHLTLSDGTNNHAINLSASTGTVIVTGSLTESGGANMTFTGAGALNIGNDFIYTSGTFTPASGTVTYNGSGAQTVAGVTYNQLAFNKAGGTATLGTSATVNGNLTLTNAGTFLVNAALTVTGHVTVNPGTTLNGGSATISFGGNLSGTGTFAPGTGTALFNGTATQSIGKQLFNHLTVNKSSGTLTLATNLSINGDFNLAAGTADLAGFTADRNALGGTLTLAGGTTLAVGNSFPANFSTRSLAASSVVEYTGTTNQTVSAENYGHLRFSNGGSNVKTLAGTATVAGDLLINSNATFYGGAASLTVSGNWTNSGTFTPATSAVTLSGSGKTLSGANTFNTLTVSGSYTAGNTTTVNGVATVSGSFAAGTNACAFAGDFNNSGSFTSAGSVTFSGTGAQAVTLNSGFVSSGTVNFDGSVSPTFGGVTVPGFRNVNVNNTAGIAPALGWIIGGDFTVAGGATFAGGAATHTFAGSVTNSGTLSSSGTLLFAPTNAVTLSLRGTSFAASGTVTFGGTGAITISPDASGLTFSSVQVLNTHATGLTPSASWTLSGDLLVGAGATFNGGGVTLTVAGKWTVNGAFSGGSSVVVLNPAVAGEVGGVGTSAFNHLTISGTVTNTADVSISGNFTNNGAFDATGFNVTFDRSSAATIAGSTTPTTIDSLVIAKTSATVTLGLNVNGLTALTISSGTLDTGAYSVSQVTGGVLTVGAGGTLKLGGNNAFPTFDTVSLDAASTVEYSGGSAQTIAAQNYGNLTSSGSGSRTLASSGTIGVAGTFTPGANTYTITGSTIAYNGSGAQTIAAFNYQNLTSSSTGARTLASSGTISVAGTFTPGANSFTVTGSTVNFNGGAQTIPVFTYGNLTTSGSGAKTLGGNATASGAVSLGGGSFADGGFTLTANGDIANSITHSGAGKILLSGGGTNHVLSGAGAFQNLELSDTNGAALSTTNLTVNGTLTLTSGALATSTNKIIVATGASVSRTNGWVNGSLQKNVATGATSRTFEIGDATNYAPATVAFGNVTTAGNLAAFTTPGDNSDIANSGVAAARSVNRTWTFTNNGVLFNNFSATFNFAPADIDLGANYGNFIVARKDTNWTLPVIIVRTATNIQASGMTAFSTFQVGESTSAPTFTTQPQSQTVTVGSNVTFTAAASGATPLGYQWRFNNGNITGATNPSVTLMNVQTSNAGNYTVVVTNGYGSDTSSTAALTVLIVSSVSVSSSKNPSGFKDSVTFTASLPADATGSVTFLTNGVAMSTGSLSSGTATGATTLLPRGTTTLTAQYPGDGKYLGSTNDLAGGQVVTNHSPVAGTAYFNRPQNISLKLAISGLLTNVTDADSDTITLTGVSSSTPGATVKTNSTQVLYASTNNAGDSFSYTVSDSHGGSATGSVVITVAGQNTGQNATVSISGSTATLTFYGVPGLSYITQRSTNLTDWVNISTNTAPAGVLFQVTDNSAPAGSAYYRLSTP